MSKLQFAGGYPLTEFTASTLLLTKSFIKPIAAGIQSAAGHREPFPAGRVGETGQPQRRQRRG